MPKLLPLLALLLAAGVPQAVLAADTVFVVRHMQKADGADPPLSTEGVANAQALADKLATSGITAIFATQTRRAMETAQPLAARLGLTVMPYDPGKPEALAAKVAALPGAVLIVGHSNTVPDLIARVGGREPVTLTEQDYGTVFVVTHDDGKVSRIEVHPAH
jgi:broad specificity phosphatase PhoE